MGISIVQQSDGSMGLAGQGAGQGEFYEDTTFISAATVGSTMFTVSRPVKIVAIYYRPDVAGTDASAVTAVINKCASTVAPASGTIVHSGTINLKGTAATNQVIAPLTTAAIVMAAGDSLCFVPTGVMTAVVGTVTVICTLL